MRHSCYFLLAIVLLLLTSRHAVATATDSDLTKESATVVSSPMTRSHTTDEDGNRRRLLRSDTYTKTGRTDDSEIEEERGLIPSGLATQLKGLKTPGLPTNANSLLEKLQTEGFTKTTLAMIKKIDISKRPAKVNKVFRKIKNASETYVRNAYWQIRFTIWMKKKYTPSFMYDKLKIREKTPFDKEYQVYTQYFREYERFHGQTFDPRHVYGPKVDVV